MMNKNRKNTIQLTPLLDLLFVMVFVSLMQSQTAAKKAQTPEPTPAPTPTPTPQAKATPEATPKPEPTPQKTLFFVDAVFHFYGTPQNPNLPTGKFAMQGKYNRKTGRLQLGGVQWIQRPSNYEMVPLNGNIDPTEETFTGRIEFQGCQKFTLRRTSKSSGPPIAGKWKGSYRCTQGETGLTLTIR